MLISAPAGFGKTTVVSDWIGHSGMSVAWLSLDESDNDLTHFLTYFFAALQRINPAFGETALGMLRRSRPPPAEALMTPLLNEIAASPTEYALVLDDYHVIESPLIDQALTFLLDHQPPQMHLIIATRTDPSLPLSRLRARGQITEIRADDLRFTFDEAKTFLDEVMGLNLSAEHVTALETRTEGWIAGLQLAALSMQGLQHIGDITSFIKSFTGSNRYIIDYLADEVLRQRPKGTEAFLLKTSILSRLCGPLCDAVLSSGENLTPVSSLPSASASSQNILEMLERANLFVVPLDNERCWYRYHHLFADLLRRRLEVSQPGLVPALHRRASAWYAQNDLMAEAIAHSLAAEDFDQAARLTEQTFFDRMSHGEDFATMLARLAALPDEIIRARPRLGIMYAWMLAITLQLDTVEPHLREVERVEGDQLPADLQLQIAHIRAELARYRGEFAQAIGLSHQILEALPKERSMTDMQTLTGTVFNLAWGYLLAGDVGQAQHWFSEALTISQAAGSLHLILLTYRGLSQIQELEGRLCQAVETCRQALGVAAEAKQRRGHPIPAAVYIHLGLGDLLREWNHLDEADRHLRQGLEIGRKWQIGGDTLRDGYLFQARLKQAQGDLAGAMDAIRQAQTLAQTYQSVPGFDAPIAAYRARLMLAQAMATGDTGHLEAVKLWLDACNLRADGSIDSLDREFAYLVWVRLLMAQNAPDQALQLLTQLLLAAEDGGRRGRIIEFWTLQALAQQALGDEEQALMTIEQALSLAEPEGYTRLFVDEGKPMAEVLRKAAARGIRLNYVRKLLTAFGAGKKEIASAPFPISPSALGEPFSERELEVLRLIAAGLTNQEIAKTLVIALGTVKTHTANIYGKLGVHSRTQAVARAGELNLL